MFLVFSRKAPQLFAEYFLCGGGGGGGVGVTFKGEFISQRPIRSCLSVMTP